MTDSSDIENILEEVLEVVPIAKFQENFDEYLEKIEQEKTSFIIESEDGTKAVMMPADDEILKIYTEHDEAS